MLIKFNSYTIFYVLIVWILGTCYGFVLLSSAAGQNGDIKLFENGDELIYNLHSTILLNEKNGNDKNVGFFISSKIYVQTLWDVNQEKLIKFIMVEPQLHIKSRKAPTPDGFVYHTSKLQEFLNNPFYIHWINGKINKILVNRDETTSIVNLKKGIAALFQFQIIDGTFEETDSSGKCTVEYSSQNDQRKILKTKKNCLSKDLPFIKNPELTLDTNIKSERTVEYEFNNNYQYLKTIKLNEKHTMSITSHNDMGNEIISNQILEFIEFNQKKISSSSSPLKEKNIKDILNELIIKENLSDETLMTEKENLKNEDTKTLSILVNDLRDQLNSELLGSVTPAKAFVKLVKLARKSHKEEIKKVINTKKNIKILPQLMDVLGSTPTLPSYEAVMSKLDFTKEDQIDLNERYLWALSLNSNPNPDIAERLLIKLKKDCLPKLNETLLLTLASMGHRLNIQQRGGKVTQQIEKLIIDKLNESKGDESYPYLRAVKNLKSNNTIPTLLKKIKYGTSKEGALSWRALKSFNKTYWNQEVLKTARKTLLQLDKKHDSSSRTISSEIILESNPDDKILKEIIYHLASNDTVYEVKQYLLQKIRMLIEDDQDLNERVTKIIKNDKKINNYSILNPRGLSTAIKRYFIQNQSGKGSLVSLQEISNAVVKRGVVNVLWDKENGSSELFSLGIFTSGLTSFLSSDNEESNEEPEPTSAGMELTVLGTQLRPFVFFNGQGELMGHVWSGTASDRTTAYQALIMLQDHLEYLRLGSGFIIELDLKGAVSFDLAGKVEISLWGRTAESLVEKCAGIFVTGSIKLDTEFIRSQVEFTASLEPQIKLTSDIDFSSSMRCCMKLSQLDVLLKHNVYKIERIPGSKHKLRIAKYRKLSSPGKTFSLNRKNNEMCSAIHRK